MPTYTLPLGSEAELRGMRGRDEDILTDAKKQRDGTALDEMMASCTLRLDGNAKVQVGDITRLKSPDRVALLLQIRKASYGPEVSCDLQCPACKEKFSVVANIDELPVKAAPAGSAPYDVTLTVDDKPVRVSVDFLDGRKEVFLSKVRDNVATENILSRIVEVEGVDKNGIRAWLKDLPVTTRSDLRAKMAELDCGIDPTGTADCPSCHAEVAFNVQTQPSFFFQTGE